MRLYLDSSALVKLVQRELESAALREFLRQYRQDERVASELARVEVVRSVLAGGPPAVTHARRQLARLYLMAVDRDVLDRAATLVPTSLGRSLDAPAQLRSSVAWMRLPNCLARNYAPWSRMTSVCRRRQPV